MSDGEPGIRLVETRGGGSTAAVHAAGCDDGADPGATVNTKAKRMFLRRVQEIPGVVHVEPIGGQVIGEQSFIVYVRDGDIAAEYRVYELEGEVYGQYPEAYLTVDLLEESDIPEDSLGGSATKP
jgi:hypothetical protein